MTQSTYHISHACCAPGNAGTKSHHILTISDLEETRRPRRHSCTIRGRNASPPRAEGSSLLPRSLPFGSPSRHPHSHPKSLATSGLSSPCDLDAVGSHPSTHGHPPTDPSFVRARHSESEDATQDFTALSDSEDATLVPTNGLHAGPTATDDQAVLLVTDELCTDPAADEDAVVLVTDQGMPYGHFDVDADEAVASMLNTRLDFDEALLQENMALQCRAHTQGGEGMGEDGAEVGPHKAGETVDSCHLATSKELSLSNATVQRPENESSDDDMDHYLNFSRTVVVPEASRDAAQAGVTCLSTSGTISQLDGADNESESDAGEVMGEDDSQELGKSSENRESEPSSGAGTSVGRVRTVTTSESCSKTADVASVVVSLQGSDASAESQDCVFLDLNTGEFVSADRGLMAGSSGCRTDSPGGHSSTDSVEMDDLMPLPASMRRQFASPSQAPGKPRPFSNPRVRVIETSSPQTLLAVDPPTASPRPRQKMVKLLVPAARSRTPTPSRTPALPRTAAPPRIPAPPASTPAFRAVPLKDPVTAAPIVINGFGSTAPQNETPKGKPIVIRLKNPEQHVDQQRGVTATTPPQAPQILLVNRFGQILMKDPQSNTYQSPNATSPSLKNISQIAKFIHTTQSALTRPVPKLLVTPVSTPSAVAPPPKPRVTTHIISYTTRGGLAPAKKVLVQKVATPSEPKPVWQIAPSQSLKLPSVRVENATARQQGTAQAIIDKAMASHREGLPSPKLSPSQFTVHPFLNKLESPQAVAPPPSALQRARPTILGRSAASAAGAVPQVRVKRVSSVAERLAVKRCRTDFLPQTPPAVAMVDPSGSAAAAAARLERML